MERYKANIALFVLIAFLLLVVGGSVTMHHNDMSGTSGCPFTAGGFSLCSKDVVGAAMHHVASYQSFLSAQPVLSVVLLLALIVLGVLALSIFVARLRASDPQFAAVALLARTSPLHQGSRERTTRWLSLFEHSPSRF